MKITIKQAGIALFVVFMILTCWFVEHQAKVDAAFQTKVYFDAGGDRINIVSGGTLNSATGSTVTLLGKTMAFASYAADPNADSLDVETTGTDSDDMVVGTLQSDTAGNDVYITAIVPRTDTTRVFLNVDPDIAITVKLLSYQD